MPITAIAQQGDTLDQICKRHLGLTGGVTEAAYALNPGLAAHGPVLRPGHPVVLPDPPTSATSHRRISLWD